MRSTSSIVGPQNELAPFSCDLIYSDGGTVCRTQRRGSGTNRNGCLIWCFVHPAINGKLSRPSFLPNTYLESLSSKPLPNLLEEENSSREMKAGGWLNIPPPCVLTLMPAGTRAAWQCAILRNEERAVLPLAKPKAQKYISAISKHGGYSWTSHHW